MRKAVETNILSPKELFKNRLHELPGSVRSALAGHKLKVSDHEYYAIVKANGQANVDIFTKSLDEGPATNLHQGIVPNNAYFLVTSIVLTTAVGGAASTINDAVSLDFTAGIDPIIQNAKFTFKCGQDTYFDNSGAGIFQSSKTDLEPGEYKVSNPKFIYSKQDLTFEIEELGAALAAETWVKIRLKGLLTTKK